MTKHEEYFENLDNLEWQMERIEICSTILERINHKRFNDEQEKEIIYISVKNYLWDLEAAAKNLIEELRNRKGE